MTKPFDPAAFRPEAMSLETLASNEELARTIAALPIARTVAEQRAQHARGAVLPVTPKSPRASLLSTPGKEGHEIALRVIAPPTPAGVYLHIHGGGWMMGSADMRDGASERIAQNAGLATVSVSYRLAPEHPYPAAADDCERAALWLIEHAERTFGTTRLIIGGQSAGANLAVLTLLRLRDGGHATAFCAANLVYGVFDLSMTPSVRRAENTLVTDRRRLDRAMSAFAGPKLDRRDPQVSPLYADLHDLPQALFTIGTLDPLLDDSLFMYARWIAAGNAAQLAVYPGGVHGFTAFANKLATDAQRRIDDFLAGATA